MPPVIPNYLACLLQIVVLMGPMPLCSVTTPLASAGVSLKTEKKSLTPKSGDVQSVSIFFNHMNATVIFNARSLPGPIDL